MGSIRRMRDNHGVCIFHASDDGSGIVKAVIAVFDIDLDVEQYP